MLTLAGADVIARAAPEESRLLRVVVVVAVVIGVLAAAVQQAVPAALAGPAVLALLGGSQVAHRYRHGAPGWVKAVAAVVVPLALVRALGGARDLSTLDEARFTLAELFVVVQVVHTLDLPRRRDLYVSLGSSLVLLAVAASLSQDMRFGVFLLLWAATALAALVLIHRSSLAEGTAGFVSSGSSQGPGTSRRDGSTPLLVRHVARGVAIAIAAGALVFLVVPPTGRAGQLALPFRVGNGGGLTTGGLLRSPPTGGDNGESGGRSDGAAYFGLSTRMDLRTRGSLPDDVVMRVLAGTASMWRGAVFDTYNGVAWTGDEDVARVVGGGPQYDLPTRGIIGPRVDVAQTFYLEAALSNAIYAAGEPRTAYYPSGVNVDRLGGLRADSTLEDGTVYSVVSAVGAATPDQLRTAPATFSSANGRVGASPLDAYLQLPAGLPDRVAALAADVTAGATSDYDRVRRLETYLRESFPYRLDSAVPPEGRDAVDHFLFDAREGFCEQFAAAMAVMARTLGVPARVATGYVPGSYNALTGYFTVRASDAHAWVEVFHPGFGWYPYDPTSSVPAPQRSVLAKVPVVRLVRWISARFTGLAPIGRGAAVTLVLVGVGALADRWRRRRRQRDDDVVPGEFRMAPVLDRGPATAALARLDAALSAGGSPRRTWETPRELLARAHASAAAGAVDREAYSTAPPDADADAAAQIIDRAIAALGEGAPSSGRLR